MKNDDVLVMYSMYNMHRSLLIRIWKQIGHSNQSWTKLVSERESISDASFITTFEVLV